MAAGYLLLSASAALAQGRALEMVVGLAPGGAGDVSARLVARHLEKHLGQPIVVTNKPGAGQMMAAGHLAKSAADAQMLGYLTNAIITAEISGLAKGVYQVKDLTPFCQVNASGSVLVVRSDLPIKNYQQFEAYLKNNKLTAGHQGNGSANHYRLAALSKFRKLPMVMVPFRGEADVMTNILGKHIDIAAVSPTTALNNLASGHFKVLMAWGEQPAADFGTKLTLLSDIDPTIPDVGVKTYLWARATASKEYLSRLKKSCEAVAKDKDFASAFTQAGFDLVYRSAEEAGLEIQKDRKRYAEILSSIDLEN